MLLYFFFKNDLDDLHKEKHLDYKREDVICDTFFAVIGAIYVDQVNNINSLFITFALIIFALFLNNNLRVNVWSINKY